MPSLLFNAFILPLINIWNYVFYYPSVNIILIVYKYLGGNLGVSIIVITIIFRVLLAPSLNSQMRYMRRIGELKPKLDKLNQKYKGDKKALAEAQMSFYKENGINPAGSCLPLILQLPILFAVYDVINTATQKNAITVFNKIAYSSSLRLPIHSTINTNFLWMNLSNNAYRYGFGHIPGVLPYIVLALLVGLSQYYTTKLTTDINTAKTTDLADIVEKKDSEFDAQEFSTQLSKQMMITLPILLVVMSLGILSPIPSGLSIYWLLQSVLIILQTYIFSSKKTK